MVALRGSADGGRDKRRYGIYRCRVPWTAEAKTVSWETATVRGAPVSIPGARILGPDATCVNSSETAVAPLRAMGYFPETSTPGVCDLSLNSQKVTLFALLLLAVGFGSESATAESGYYKWFDARGNPQHSDRPPPPGVEYEFISTETGLRRRVEREESSDSASSAPAMPPIARPRPTAAEEQVVIKKDPGLCDKAKANLDTLNSSARVRIRDENGIRYLTEEEKDVQRRKAEDLISIHCSS